MVASQLAELRHSKAVPEGDQDHGRIAMAVPVALGHPDQALDFALGEVLAIAAHVPKRARFDEIGWKAHQMSR
jgi:hypothetical protein